MTFMEFFRDWETATKELSDSEKGRLMSALVADANGKDVAVSGNERFVYPIFSARLKDEKKRERAV